MRSIVGQTMDGIIHRAQVKALSQRCLRSNVSAGSPALTARGGPMGTRVFIFIMIWFWLSALESANADWQYTKWGMTPEQAIEASGGKLAKNDGKPPDPKDKDRALLKGKHVSGQFEFDAVIYFNINTNQLSRLSLTLLNPTLGFLLRQSLIQKYGTPMLDSGDTLRLSRWHDTSENNVIELLQIGTTSSVLRYLPLRSADNRGL